MQDNPPAPLLVAEARKALEAGLAAGFPQKVAANALGIAQRQFEMATDFDRAEGERLASLLNRDGPIAELNNEVCRALRDCAPLDIDSLLEHLILTSCAKLAVDQPTYPGYRTFLSQERARR